MKDESGSILYQPHQIEQLLASGALSLIDIRDREDFLKGHVPGAVNLPQLFYYLAETTPEGLRAVDEELQGLFRAAGVTPGKKAIVYEQSLDTRYGGSCRGYWFLRYAGHPDCGILDGGLEAWLAAGLLLETGEHRACRSDFEIRPRTELLATRQDVERALTSGEAVLLDNRDEVEWTGQSSSPYGIDFAPRKGRIPGARWIEWYEFLDRSVSPVRFRTPQEILALCAAKGIFPENNIILYCFKGARSSNTFIALTLAGFRNVRLFLGSWNEWSRDPDVPVDV